MAEEAKRKTKSLVQLRTQRFPGALFLEDGILLRAEVDWREQRDIGGELEGRHALERKIRGEIRSLVDEHNEGLAENQPLPDSGSQYQDEMPLPEDARLEFIEYREVRGVPGYDWFVCDQPNCERLFHLETALKTSFRCPEHNRTLSQLAHLFIHNACGHVEMIKEEKCWNEGCGAKMRLHLHPPNMRRSYWWCPECKKKGRPARPKKVSEGNWGPAWRRDLFKNCPVCRARYRTEAQLTSLEAADQENYNPEDIGEDYGGRVRMGLTTARTAFKPMTLTTVDIGEGKEHDLLAEWFQDKLDISAIRTGLPEYLRSQFDDDPNFRRSVLQAKRTEKIGDDEMVVTPPARVREVLRDYAGARDAVRQTLDNVHPQHADYLLQKCGVRASILDGLAVVNATYGYLKGSSDPKQAQLEIFHMGSDRYAVLTQRLETEALLIELEPQWVLKWLQERGSNIPVGSNTPEKALRRYLITRPSTDEVLDDVARLVHTMSHLLIRTSERVTGVSRDNLQEIVWPRTLAFVLYNGSGADLGMLQTTFEGSMFDWFHGARYDAANCPYDPVCRNADVAACHACLYIAERNCNTFWNRWLDRRHLITFDDGPVGFWGAAL
jgi:hypothetical protein